MLDYSPINWRRMEWFVYLRSWDSWTDLHHLDGERRSLTIQAYRGYLSKK